MAIYLLIIPLISIFLIYYTKLYSISKGIIFSLLWICGLTIIETEFFSFFKQFNYNTSCLYWSIVSILSILLSRKHLKKGLNRLIETTKNNKLTIIILFTCFLALLTQGILYPPNNWDSMTYHMARITHWVMNESVYPYPTHIYRQIYQPPLGEWIIAQVCILSKSDLFANSIQLIFMCGGIAILNLIGNEFKLNKRAKIIAFIITLTTPSIILQTTSTQNDIVVGFFILNAIYFC